MNWFSQHHSLWRSETGTEWLLEVTEGMSGHCFDVSKLKGKNLASHCFLRPSLISKILSTLEELCPALEAQECFCHPDKVRYPSPKYEDMSLYSVTSI